MKKITLIDLNNFAHYPTLAIGYLKAILNNAGYETQLLSPLSQGVGSREREKVETKMDYYRSLLTTNNSNGFRSLVKTLKTVPLVYNSYLEKNKMFEQIVLSLDERSDLVLISTYLENFHICKKLSAYLKTKNIPVIVGGPAFNDMEVARSWSMLDGVDVLFGSEVDGVLEDLIADFFAGNNLDKYPGVYQKGQVDIQPDYIFKDMESLPAPDFDGFPWEKYPYRIIPYMTSRGCGWGRCNFCTDVTYVIGRSFRTFTPEKVVEDLTSLSQSCKTGIINFTDSKLNSNLKVWDTIINELPKKIADFKWFCSVHVDNRDQNGLDIDSLEKAKQAGLLRITFGLESGSQRILDHIDKGTKLEQLEQFIQDVHAVGVSLRVTMFVGYPWETAEDLKLTYDLLKRNEQCFDRVKVARFSIIKMAPVYQQVCDAAHLENLNYDSYPVGKLVKKGSHYSKYKKQILKLVNTINSKPLRPEAVEYDGIM